MNFFAPRDATARTNMTEDPPPGFVFFSFYITPLVSGVHAPTECVTYACRISTACVETACAADWSGQQRTRMYQQKLNRARTHVAILFFWLPPHLTSLQFTDIYWFCIYMLA